MWGSTTAISNTNLNSYVNFKPVETKETKVRDPHSPRVEFDTVIYCVNCQPEYIGRDIEEIRLFEYSYSCYALLLAAAKQKFGQTPTGSVGQFGSFPMSQTQTGPLATTSSFAWPMITTTAPSQFGTQFSQPASQPASMSAFSSFNPQQSTSFPQSSSNIFSSFPTASSAPTLPSFGSTSSFPSAGGFNTFNNLENKTSLTGFAPATTQFSGISSFPTIQSSSFPSSTMPSSSLFTQNTQGLSNVWNSTSQQSAFQPVVSSQTLSLAPAVQPQTAQPQAMYPSSYQSYGQMPYPQYPPYPPPCYPPRYPMYYDPYMATRMPFEPPQRDPYSYMYRDGSYMDSFRESDHLHKLLMQRQAAQALYYKYGIDPNIPLSESFFSSRAQPPRPERDASNHIMSQTTPKEPVIHVMPTIAGVKDGKQQIVLDIQETPENRHYIPKIFNPNSEISFTITSKDISTNKSHLASLVQDSVDDTAPENLVGRSPKSFTKDLPKPILNKRLTPRKKSILDMDLSDYQISTKIEHVSDISSDKRRVTFQDGPTVLGSNDSGFLSPQTVIPKASQSPKPFLEVSDVKPKSPVIPEMPISVLGGSLASYEDRIGGDITNHSLNDSTSLVSKFKWTPSWFISKLVSKFSQEPSQSHHIDESVHSSSLTIKPSCGLVLNRDSYYTIPSIDDLDRLVVDNHCYVKNFTVGRYNVGKVVFEGETDVYNINLDQIVFIREYEIEVYRDDDPLCVKPPVGCGLNKPAVLTLYNVFPKDVDGRIMRDLDSDSLAAFEAYLTQKAKNLNAEFLEYDPRSGSFSFSVSHFTKYSIIFQKVDNPKTTPVPPIIEETVKPYSLVHEPKLEEEGTCKALNLTKNRKYAEKLFQMYSNPELCYNRNIANWIGAQSISVLGIGEPTTCSFNSGSYLNIQNQFISLLELRHNNFKDNDISDMDFFKSTNINTLFSSLIKCVNYELKGVYIPSCHFSNTNNILDQYLKNSKSQVFGLLRAVWTKAPTYTFDSSSVARKKHILNWMKITYGPEARVLSRKYITNNDVFSATICLLSAHLMEEAVALLNSSKNFRTASLLVVCKDDQYRQTLSYQLDQWIANGIYELMDIPYIKLLMLMCGKFVLEFEKFTLHVCEGLNWMQCLALFLIFSHPLGSVSDSFQLYVQHYQDYPEFVAPPYFLSNESFDIKFHILKYFICSDINMASMFETNTYTRHPIDYSLSWNVYMIVKMMTGMHFQNENALTSQFSTQLESMGFWQFAVFILQFIKCDITRSRLVTEMIRRHIIEVDNYIGILSSLFIPDHVIYYEKATWLLYNCDNLQAIDVFSSCGQYDRSHRIAIKYLIPRLFINSEYDKCVRLLTVYESSDFSIDSFYRYNGKIYLDFIRVHDSTANITYDMKTIDSLLDILSRLVLMESVNHDQRLARSIIAMRCVDYISKTEYVTQVDVKELVINCIVPPDFAREYIIKVFDKLE